MANFKLIKGRSEVMRIDADFKKWVQELSRFKSAQENKDIKSARITKAILNQYNKYPELLREMKLRKLGDDLK